MTPAEELRAMAPSATLRDLAMCMRACATIAPPVAEALRLLAVRAEMSALDAARNERTLDEIVADAQEDEIRQFDAPVQVRLPGGWHGRVVG